MFQVKAKKRLWSFNRLETQGTLDRGQKTNKPNMMSLSHSLLGNHSPLGWEEQKIGGKRSYLASLSTYPKYIGQGWIVSRPEDAIRLLKRDNAVAAFTDHSQTTS